MIKIDYTFTNRTPIHTGSDIDTGTTKTLRRQKIILETPRSYSSSFNDETRRQVVVNILKVVDGSIDFSSMPQSRRIRKWDEHYSKLISASMTSNRFEFFNRLCSLWDIRSVKDDSVILLLEQISDDELLDTIRNEAQYIITKLRYDLRIQKEGESLFDIAKKSEKEDWKYEKTWELVPCISGNSIRGKIRRLVMADFCKLAGITKLSKDNYHILFTGGVLTDSTQYEDIEKREKLIEMCPMIGVLGSAIGNMTISGMLSVGFAYPQCRELGTGSKSYWEYLDTVFQTRLDTSKTEKQIEIIGDHEGTDQMKYEYEVFAPGTLFNHSFRLQDIDERCTSAFYHLLGLFIEDPFVGGMFAVGNAELDLSGLLEIVANDIGKMIKSVDIMQYREYIKQKKEAICEFFSA